MVKLTAEENSTLRCNGCRIHLKIFVKSIVIFRCIFFHLKKNKTKRDHFYNELKNQRKLDLHQDKLRSQVDFQKNTSNLTNTGVIMIIIPVAQSNLAAAADNNDELKKPINIFGTFICL